MDLFALGTPVIDRFAKASDADLERLGLKKGATNHFGLPRLRRIEAFVKRRLLREYPGDNARNVCEGFAALGGSCCFQGAVGKDRDGRRFEKNLADCGITPLLHKVSGRTGRIVVLITEDSQRTFCAYLGAGKKCGFFDKRHFGAARMLFLSSITLCLPCPTAALAKRYLSEAKRSGKRVAISLESYPLVARRRRMLLEILERYADVLFLNQQEACALLGRGFEKALPQLKPSAIICLKKGRLGSELFYKGKKWKIRAIAAKAADTTGAGDAYAAGVLCGLSRGYPPLRSARLGSMLAGMVVQRVGAGLPSLHAERRAKIKK
ncbi:MAG: adenosine kinase [Candidatus Micrarchaeota archaeon]|nr:adenosine kinase [Candidatus Micrarchaeota archaeon]